MRNKKVKVFISVVFAIICILVVSNIVFASDNFNFNRFDDISNSEINDATENIIGTAINVVRIVGTGVSIIMITYIGIKYMTSAPNEKAEYKKTASIYIVGAILVFAGTQLLTMIAEFATTNIVTSVVTYGPPPQS